VNTPPLAIVQARLKSTRLPNKMLLKLGDETLIARAVRLTSFTFGAEHTVVAIPFPDWDGPLGDELRRIGAQVSTWFGAEHDVLGRFHHTAHSYRWHPDSVIVRITPDDPWKRPDEMLRVARGERRPVEWGGEAFTLAQLDVAHGRTDSVADREHITHALFAVPGPRMGNGNWTIDTPEQYAQAVADYVE
jgi:glutamate-1-semialdehyde 2,1-aminomutase